MGLPPPPGFYVQVSEMQPDRFNVVPIRGYDDEDPFGDARDGDPAKVGGASQSSAKGKREGQ